MIRNLHEERDTINLHTFLLPKNLRAIQSRTEEIRNEEIYTEKGILLIYIPFFYPQIYVQVRTADTRFGLFLISFSFLKSMYVFL